MADNSTKIIISAEDKASGTLGSIGKALGGLGGAAGAANSALASLSAGAALAGLTAIAKSAIDAADGLNDLSQRTGISVKNLAAYKLAAEQSGTSLDAVAKGVKGLSKAMLDNGDALKAAGITAKDANGAMRQLADLFSQMPDGPEKLAVGNKLLGKSFQELIPMFNMGSAGLDKSAEAAQRYGDAMSVLAPQADAFNDSMSALSLNLQAMGAELAGQLAPTLNVIAEAMVKTSNEATGLSASGMVLKTTLETIAVLGVNVAYVFNSVGKEIGGMAAQMTALATLDFKGFLKIGELMKEDAARARQEVDALSERILNPPKVEAPAAKGAPDDATLARWKALVDATRSGAAALKEYDAQGEMHKQLLKDLAAEEKARLERAKWAAQAADEIIDAEEKQRQAIEKSIGGLREKIEAMELETSLMGMSADARERTIMLLALEAEKANLTAGAYDQLKERIEAALSASSARRSAVKAAEDAGKAWEKFADDIERSLTDALMRGFEAGDGFAESFVKSLQNTLKTAALKIAVQAVLDPITGQGGILQQGASALGLSGQGGSAGNLLSAANNFTGIGGFAQAGINTAAYTSFGSMGVEQAAMLAAQDSVFGAAGTAATLEAAGAAGASSVVGAIGTALPYIGAAVAAISLFSSVFDSKGGPKDKFYGGDPLIASKTNRDYNAGLTTSLDVLEKSLTTIAGKFGNDLKDVRLQVYGTSDPEGDAKDQYGYAMAYNGGIATLSQAGNGGEMERGQVATAEGMAKITSQMMIDLLGDLDLGSAVNDYLDQFDIRDTLMSMGADQAATILATVEKIGTLTDALEKLWPAILPANISSIADQFGGYDQAIASVNSYYDAIYNSTEKVDLITQQVTRAFDDLGIAMPATLSGFRAIVDSLDTTTDAGRETFAALINLAPAFAQVADAAISITDLIEKARSSTLTAADAAFGALSNSVQAEISRIENQRDTSVAALDQQAASISRILDSATALAGSLDDAIATLRGAVAGPQQSIAAARINIDTMLADAFAGALPDQDALQRALTTVTADTPDAYATKQEWQRAQAVQAAKLDTLASLIKRQGDGSDATLDAINAQREALVAAADSQIDALNAQLNYASQQLDALKGIDTGVLSMADALAQLASAISAAQGVRTPVESANAIAAAYDKYLGRTPDDAGLDYWKTQVGSGESVSSVISNIANSAEAQVNSLYGSLLGRTPDTAGAQYWTSLISAGTSIQAITDAIKQSDEYRTLQGFAIGTNYVPRTGVAMIHEGERIIPAADNRALMQALNGGNVVDIRPLLAEMQALREEMKAQQTAIATNTLNSAKYMKLWNNDGMPEVRVVA